MTRAATLLLALFVQNIVLGVICLAVARRDRASRALRLWGAGLVVYALGLLVTIATFLPVAFSKVGGNALICYAPILCINGALKHTRYRMNQRWVLAGFVISVLPLIINHIGPHPQVLVDFMAALLGHVRKSMLGLKTSGSAVVAKCGNGRSGFAQPGKSTRRRSCLSRTAASAGVLSHGPCP